MKQTKQNTLTLILVGLLFVLLLSLASCSANGSVSTTPSTPDPTIETNEPQESSSPEESSPNSPDTDQGGEIGSRTGNTTVQLDMLRLAEGGTDFPTPWLRTHKGGGSRKHMLIYDSLLEKSDKELVPWLAESYNIAEDGRTYTFTLRDNIKWHDGKPMTANDIVFSFNYFAKHIPVSSSLDYSDIESVKAIDERTVEIITTEKSATLLENIGKVSIIPQHVWEKVDDPYNYEGEDALVASGPYILEERNLSESVMVYRQNPDFWGPKPAAKKLYWLNISEDVIAYEQGEIDIIRNLTVEDQKSYEQKENIKIVKGPAFSGSRLIFNMLENPFLADKRMRQAIYYAFDTYEMIEKIGSGLGEASNPGILPPAHIMYNPNTVKYDHNPEKAIKLLEKLGFTTVGDDGIRVNANGDRLSFDLLASSSSGRSATASLFAEQMQRVGIEFVLTVLEGKVQEERVANNDFETAIVGHAGLGSDADYLRKRYGDVDLGKSTTELSSKGYINEETLALLNEQRQITDVNEREKIIYRIQELMAEDAVEIMMYYSYMVSAHDPAVWDGWMYQYDERSVTGCKLSYVLYDEWIKNSH